MKTLKKTLCVVLAVVMVVGTLALTAGATDYVDDAEITYDEAVEVLSGMGIFEGGDGNAFDPQRSITRAEMATVMYRITTGDVDGSQAVIYSKLDKFPDVDEDDWFAGYVNYCAHEGIVVGDDFGNFNPDDKVTGHQVLIMLLRAIGYNAQDEFTGDDWNIEAAAMANEMKITRNIDVTKLSNASPREEVAEMTFRAISENDMVKWVPAIGYVSTNETIGEHEFDLTKDTAAQDIWGRPSDKWTFTGGSVSIAYEPDAYYDEAVAECDVYEAVGLTKDTSFVTYTNGEVNKGTETINKLATRATIGAQGRETYVYTDVAGVGDIIVYIDTFLAQVTGVTEVKYDDAGHIAKQATLTLAVYDAANHSTYTFSANSNYDYTVGQMLLVNAVTDDAALHSDIRENADADDYVEIIGAPTAFVGGQNSIYRHPEYHIIDGERYEDSLHFHLDRTEGTQTINHNWWVDQFGNLIGVTNLERTSYAVLKDIKWVVGTDSYGYAQATLVDMNGDESTVVVNSIDGQWLGAVQGGFWNVNDVEPSLDDATTGFVWNDFNVSEDPKGNADFEGYALYLVYTNDDGTVNLEGYDTNPLDVLVNYDGSATIDVGGSEIEGVNGTVNVSTNTKFLVRTGVAGNYTYTTYNINNLPDFANGTIQVFWSKLGAGNITQNVYIKSATPQATTGTHLFVTEESHTWQLTENQTRIHAMNVVVDGAPRTIRTTSDNVIDVLENNVGKLFHVTFDTTPGDATYGYVTDVELVNEASDTIASDVFTDWVCNYLSGTITVDGDTIIDSDSTGYNLTDVVEVINSSSVNYDVDNLEDAVAEGMGIWVVDNRFDGITNRALTIYIGTKLSESTAYTVAVDGKTASIDEDGNIWIPNKGDTTDATITFGDDYALYWITVNGIEYNSGNPYRGDHAPVVIEDLKKTDTITVEVLNEENADPTEDTTYTTSTTINVDGWEKIVDGVDMITYFTYNRFAEDLDVYYSYEDAVNAAANLPALDVDQYKAVRVYADTALIATQSYGMDYMTFSNSSDALSVGESGYQADKTAATKATDDGTYFVLPFDSTVDPFVVLSFTPFGEPYETVYVAFNVNMD